ncbi:MAG TPA: toll/interleukin-1 receptor domain-containing protein [Stellaceae bacterium]|nr:toll/interleukin-1 receptor domain-containing protein [Stellaceae bacterium]
MSEEAGSSEAVPPSGEGAGECAVFVSHSSRDAKVARSICNALELRGHRCWISSRDIGPGENFQEAIVRAIRQARLMVLVFTGNANNSNEIKKEMALASQANLTVIPVRVEDVVPNDAFAYEFATRQWIDTFGDWEQAIERLSLQVGTILHGGSAADALASSDKAAQAAAASRPPAPNRTALYAGLAIAVGVLVGGGAYFAFQRAPSSPAPAAAPAPAPQAAAPAPAAPAAAAPGVPVTQPIVAEATRDMRDKNYDESFRLFQQAAAQGNAVAQYWTGFHYQQGFGVAQDYAKAMEWYRKAADQGYPAGMVGIGNLYDHGFGVTRDFVEAMRWYRMGAEAGGPAGMLSVGNLYENGQGVPQDYQEAMRWYRLAADKNWAPAMYAIGLNHERGNGVPVNLRQARNWMKKAADAGSTEAAAWLAAH